jgi:predicted Fe-Mo cluster-binding NifX family protein
MKIAVTSQNRRDITGHAGRCRNFRVFDVDQGIVLGGIGHDGED